MDKLKSKKLGSELDHQYSTVEPAAISWHNIEVFSKQKRKFCVIPTGPPPQHIIKNVSGYLRPGTTLAIMGSSGAGKTTLLNVLTARNLTMFDVSGVVKINGKIADVQTIMELTAYVQQEDLFIPLLTVREHLVFQAMIRMPAQMSSREKVARIDQVMSELSLLKCADTRVGGGGSFKGISGGEMKRLSFAVEILTNPSIMFCDEPTSGLDAFMAQNLVSLIGRMAAKGRTIICTIHQPSTDVFNMFHNLLLLANGRIAYMGPRAEALAYFNALGYRCPRNYNPADFFVKEMAIVPGKELEGRNKITWVCDYYLSKNPPEILNRKQASSFLETEFRTRYKATVCQQFKALSWRSMVISSRQPMLSYIRLSQALSIAILLGLVYFQQPYNNFGVSNLNAALFLILTNMSFQNSLAVINTFCHEITIFHREHSSGMYRTFPYFVCKNLAEFHIFVLIPIFFVVICFYMIGFTSDSWVNILFVMSVAIITSSIGVGYGYLMSCFSANTDFALAVSPPLLMPLQLFGGFFVNNNNIPYYFKWAKEISWFRYGFELLMYNQWISVKKLACDSAEHKTSSEFLVESNDIANFSSNNQFSQTTEIVDFHSTVQSKTENSDKSAMCFRDGEQVLQFYAINSDSVITYFGIMLFMTIAMRFFAFICLLIRSRGR